jgi:hypothetical protein
MRAAVFINRRFPTQGRNPVTGRGFLIECKTTEPADRGNQNRVRFQLTRFKRLTLIFDNGLSRPHHAVVGNSIGHLTKSSDPCLRILVSDRCKPADNNYNAARR